MNIFYQKYLLEAACVVYILRLSFECKNPSITYCNRFIILTYNANLFNGTFLPFATQLIL